MLLRISIKTFSFLALILFVFTANATNYYLSASGNDANSGTDPSAPWQTLNKLNSFKNFKPRDNILFRRGDTFYGGITVSNSGTAGNPITYGAYGAGEKPVITGFTTVSNWTNLGGNIWESTDPVSTLSTCNMVVINGVNTAMGRWPNSGYLTYDSFSGNKSLTSKSLSDSMNLSGSINWKGAELVLRKNHYIIDRNPIVSTIGSTLTYTSSSSYSNTNGFGFFIQNDIRTLDRKNEWYYNPLTKKLFIYTTSQPADVQVCTIDTTVFLTSRTNITFDGISFQGSNKCTMYFWIASNIVIENCNFNFAGLNAVEAYLCSNVSVTNNFINNTNNNAIRFTSWDYQALPTYNILISQDTIKNTSILVGMGRPSDEQIERTAILVQGSNSAIRKCVIDSTGYIPIWWRGDSFRVEQNLITNFCFIKDDGGAIWTYNNDRNPPKYINQRVSNNIILNGIGALDGSVPDKFTSASGIYCDGNSSNIEISGNTVSNCNRNGILIHNAHEIVVKNNTLYDNAFQLTLFSDNDFTDNPDSVSLIRNMNITKNVLFAKDSSQVALAIVAFFNDIKNFGIIDSNYYARPIEDNFTIESTTNNSLSAVYYSLYDWQKYSGFDANSKKSPKTIGTDTDLRFEYNADSISKAISLSYPCIDVTGRNYNESITLNPFQSTILIKSVAPNNEALQANAGQDLDITLPSNSVFLSGSGNNNYNCLWTKISGPTFYTIENSSSLMTEVSGLTVGIYLFELKVTDNNCSIAKDTVQVTVNPSPDIPPTAHAGSDETITLPANSVTLSGGGTDEDGTTTAYSWAKVAGPSKYDITNAQSPITDVTGLIEGVYQFELKVTDNNGATAKDTVTITVNPQQNIPPTLNLGPNQTIMLPVNSTILTGSATDSDGYISNYLWEKISGTSDYHIENPNAAATNVTGLTEGVYQFQLTVKDDKGASASSTVQISVNSPINIAPTANSGANQTITLPTNTATLNGNAIDADGAISAYSWTKISGPAAYNISNPSFAVTTVSGLVPGVYQFEFRATDDKGAIGKDTVRITVNVAVNIPPTANAGPDVTISLPVNFITITGSGADVDGTIATYSWTKVSGPAGEIINNPYAASVTLNNLSEGVYQFELKVTGDKGDIGKDTVRVTVNAAPNIPPTSNAGADKAITLPTDSVSISGSGDDPDGGISSYSWTKISGPASYNIGRSTSAVTTISRLMQGVYQFELEATDDKGAIAKDTVQITVNALPNIPPTANAGVNQTITLPTNTAILNGSGTDSDGTVSSYSWTQISGPVAATITNPSSGSTAVKGLIQGNYVFSLTITDNQNATAADSIFITVNAAANIPPIVDAGADKTITLLTNVVTLSGSGNDTDGSISSYLWTKISGPFAYNISNSSSAITTLSGLTQGVYQFELKVTDDKGATGTDTVQLTVNPAPNIPPTANAGANQIITLPANTISFNGSGTDSDGTISSYLWRKISGPVTGTIIDSLAAATTAKGLIAGNYVFQLIVTDNKGAKGRDTVYVTVNAAKNSEPTADAGGDLTIALPLNTVYLNGSGSDTDGTITAYQWKQVAGPDSASITTDNKASSLVKYLVAGTYEFELTVTDNNGETGRDTVRVVVALERISTEPNSIKIYPNPVHDVATIRITSEKINSQLTLIISDFTGKIIYRKQISSSDYKTIEKINTTGFSKGSYAVIVFFDEKDKKVMTMIKQ